MHTSILSLSVENSVNIGSAMYILFPPMYIESSMIADGKSESAIDNCN